MEDLYSDPAIASTVDFAQIKNGYWMSMNLHGPLNPKDRIPLNSEPFLPKVSTLFMFLRDQAAIATVALRATHPRQKGEPLHVSYDNTVIDARLQCKYLFLTAYTLSLT